MDELDYQIYKTKIADQIKTTQPGPDGRLVIWKKGEPPELERVMNELNAEGAFTEFLGTSDNWYIRRSP